MSDGSAPLRILVVEDELFVRMTTVDLLEEMGHAVIEADCAQMALEKLRDNADIDLLLTDVGLPDMRGPALARTCLEMRPDLKVIFASGYDSNGISKELKDDRVVGHLGKPFQMRDIETVLRDVPRRG